MTWCSGEWMGREGEDHQDKDGWAHSRGIRAEPPSATWDETPEIERDGEELPPAAARGRMRLDGTRRQGEVLVCGATWWIAGPTDMKRYLAPLPNYYLYSFVYIMVASIAVGCKCSRHVTFLSLSGHIYRALRHVYKDYDSDYEEILAKDKSIPLQLNIMRQITLEVYKILSKQCPSYLHDSRKQGTSCRKWTSMHHRSIQ